jgi:hypothetical protein
MSDEGRTQGKTYPQYLTIIGDETAASWRSCEELTPFWGLPTLQFLGPVKDAAEDVERTLSGSEFLAFHLLRERPRHAY